MLEGSSVLTLITLLIALALAPIITAYVVLISNGIGALGWMAWAVVLDEDLVLSIAGTALAAFVMMLALVRRAQRVG